MTPASSRRGDKIKTKRHQFQRNLIKKRWAQFLARAMLPLQVVQWKIYAYRCKWKLAITENFKYETRAWATNARTSKKRKTTNKWTCCCCCCFSAYLSSCHRTASDANLLDDPHTFHNNNYFVIGGIRTSLGVSDDP